MTWDLQLDTANFRGVTFEVESLDDAIVRRLREYRYPWRDGADLDDLGREPRRTSLTAVFQGPTYETNLGAFLAVVDAGLSGVFVHPTLGTWTARLSAPSIHQDHSRRDCALVSVEVIEDGTSTKLPDLFSLDHHIEDVETWATAVETANTSAISDVTTAIAAARTWVANVKSQLDKAARAVNEVRRKIDSAIRAAQALTDWQNYDLVRSCKRLAYSCNRLAERVQRSKPKILEHVAPVPLPLSLLAHKLYGDRDRVDDLVLLNPTIRNPFLAPAGALKVHGS